MDKYLVAHELGHAMSANVQDAFWFATELSFKKESGVLATCSCEKRKTRKKDIVGPYSRATNISSIGGIYGELVIRGCWSPWGCRSDIDDFISTNKTSNPLKVELDEWMWISLDELSFRSCTSLPTVKERRKFVLDSHDTAKRLPELWKSYLDFCDRINKEKFKECVNIIAKNKTEKVENEMLKQLMKEISL